MNTSLFELIIIFEHIMILKNKVATCILSLVFCHVAENAHCSAYFAQEKMASLKFRCSEINLKLFVFICAQLHPYVPLMYGSLHVLRKGKVMA